MVKILDMTLHLFDICKSQHIPVALGCAITKLLYSFRMTRSELCILFGHLFHIFRWFFSEYFNVTILPLSYVYI